MSDFYTSAKSEVCNILPAVGKQELLDVEEVCCVSSPSNIKGGGGVKISYDGMGHAHQFFLVNSL